MRFMLALGLLLSSVPALAISLSCTEWLSSLRQSAYLRQVHSSFDKNNFYWQFPSDHLPVGGVVTTKSTRESFTVMTWNVLNQSYMDLIVNGTQGLRVSEITALDDRGPRLISIFTDLMVDLQPDVFALQEVDAPFLSRLRAWARSHGYLVVAVENPSKNRAGEIVDYGIIVYHPDRLELQSSHTRTQNFAGPSKYIQQVGFKTRRGVTFLFTNVHRAYMDHETLKNYLLSSSSGVPLVLAGDLNLNREETTAFVNQIPKLSLMKKAPTDFTHIDTARILADYDHILFTPGVSVKSRASVNMKIKKHFNIEIRR